MKKKIRNTKKNKHKNKNKTKKNHDFVQCGPLSGNKSYTCFQVVKYLN